MSTERIVSVVSALGAERHAYFNKICTVIVIINAIKQEAVENVVGGRKVRREVLPGVIGGSKDKEQETRGCMDEKGFKGMCIGSVFVLVEGQGK